MENKSSNNNTVILFVVGLILVAGISLVVGFNFGKGNNDTSVSEPQTENTTQNQESTKLDEVTALTLVQQLYDDAMEFYRLDVLENCIYKTEGDQCIDLSQYRPESPIKITNYNNIMSETFTSNGINQFENYMKNNSLARFLKEENSNMYVLTPAAGTLPAGFGTRNIKIVSIKANQINATIDIVDEFAESEGSTNAVTTKNIIIKKEDNKWLVDEFAIPMH